MKKRFLQLIFSFSVVIALILSTTIVIAAATTASGTFGNDLTWELDSGGTLVISGIGDMSWLSSNDVPWKSNASSVKKVIINNGITNIGVSAFSGCSNLTNITIPKSVSKIERWAFSGCKNISNIVLPDTLVSIGDNAFRGCDSLKSINLTNSITNIGEYAFFGCESITSITIPSSLSCIENNTFMSCSGLTTITIPNSVTIIEEQAFYFCENLSSIIVSDNVLYIGAEAFDYTAWSSAQPYGLVYLGDFLYTYKGATSMEYNASITLKEGTRGIVEGAFSSCHNLKSLNIPDSVISIGDNVFTHCSRLTNIYVDKNNAFYVDIDGVLYTKNQEKIICYPANKEATSFTIPQGVKVIEKNAFSRCINLIDVVIPNGVTEIKYDAFIGCTNLRSIILPDSTESIGEYAFSGCSNLSSITFSNNILNIETGAFRICKNLHDVFYKGTAEEWNKMSIGEDNLYLTNANIHYNFSDKATTQSVVKTTNNGCLIDISLINVPQTSVTIVAGYSREKFVTMTIVNNLENHDGIVLNGDFDCIKVMVWESFTNLKPITTSETIYKDSWLPNE